MDHDNVDAVYALLQYLYTGSYEDSTSKTVKVEPTEVPTPYRTKEYSLSPVLSRARREPFFKELNIATKPRVYCETDLIYHVDVYALADRVQNEHLKKLAEQNLKACIAEHWDSSLFPECIKLVYDITPPGPSGDGFRSVVVNCAREHSKQLLLKSSFSTMMEGVADFGRDLCKVLSGLPIGDVSAYANEEEATDQLFMDCPSCGRRRAKHSFGGKSRCGPCRRGSIY
jgi:hypothetical protein